MEFRFDKMHGLGNDFAVFEDWGACVNLTPAQATLLCDRHFGIGADGLIFIRSSRTRGCRAFMHYLNADGTLAQMCGNGIRCMAKYLVDHGFVDDGQPFVDIETRAGVRRVSIMRDDMGRFESATVDMGTPEFDPQRIPVSCAADATTPDGAPCVRDLEIGTPWGEFRFTLVSMGNPHAVCFLEDFDSLPDEAFTDARRKGLETLRVDAIGPYIEHSPLFPEKTNVEFVEPHELGLAMRVWERGCGETLACGTGACAVNVAAALCGVAGRENHVMLPGGTLRISWTESGQVLMAGPAEHVWSGVVDIPDSALG